MTSVQILHCSDLHLDKNFNIPNLARALQRKEDLNNNSSNPTRPTYVPSDPFFPTAIIAPILNIQLKQ